VCLCVVLSCAVDSTEQANGGELWNFMCYACCMLFFQMTLQLDDNGVIHVAVSAMLVYKIR